MPCPDVAAAIKRHSQKWECSVSTWTNTRLRCQNSRIRASERMFVAALGHTGELGQVLTHHNARLKQPQMAAPSQVTLRAF